MMRLQELIEKLQQIQKDGGGFDYERDCNENFDPFVEVYSYHGDDGYHMEPQMFCRQIESINVKIDSHPPFGDFHTVVIK